MYQYAGYHNVTMIGCILQNKQQNKNLWQPITHHTIPCEYFDVQGTQAHQLIPKALDFVIAHPFDVVHLSKPRITNIVIGFLYKIIWQAKIIMDIDDEELGFTKTQTAISAHELLAMIADKKSIPTNLKDEFWTRLSVGLASYFDDIVVSNPALQQRYGGDILPHVRDERKFAPSIDLTQTNREKYDVDKNSVVVLFFGTPKRHKGLLETANALANINDNRVIFLIVGDFIEPELKQELLVISGVNYQFLPNQPYDTAKDIVSLGDICVLMQEEANEISRFQLPAKLIDAIAMGLTVLLQPSPATQHIVGSSYVQAVNQDNLTEKLTEKLGEQLRANEENHANFAHAQQRDYFLQNLSMQHFTPLIHDLVARPATCQISLYITPMSQLSWFQKYQLTRKLTKFNLLQFLQYCVQHHAPIK